MGALNLIYFIFFTYYLFTWLTSSGRYVRGCLDRDREYYYSGPELFWCLMFSTGLLAFSDDIGLNLMVIRLFVLELFCIFGLRYTQDKPIWSFPLKLYSIYLIWLLIGCFYSPAPGYGVRVILKYIYPLLLALLASAIVRYVEVFLKSGIWARKVAIISLFVMFIPFLRKTLFPGVFWYFTADAINYIAIIIFSLSVFYFTGQKKFLWWAILFCFPCLIWVFRTSILGTTIAIIVFFFYRYKLKSLPVIFGVAALFIIAIFSIPSLREKMFYENDKMSIEQLQSGQITRDDIDSNGRFAMWDWSLNEFFYGKEMAGTGTGNLQDVFYSKKIPFNVRIVHNDYVQILCDNGLIGIILFVASYLLIIIQCFFVYNNYNHRQGVRLAALCAGPTLAGMMLTMYTDNVVNYSMATLSMPLGFYGMMLGMKQQELEDEEVVEEVVEEV